MEIQELDGMVAKLFQKRAEVDAQKAKLSEMNKELTAMKAELVQALKALDRDSFDSPTGKISLRKVWSVKVPSNEADKEAFFSWLKEKGAFMQYATVNSQSLNSLYRAELELATQRGDLGFSIPGVNPPSLFEDLNVRTKGTKNDDSSSEE